MDTEPPAGADAIITFNPNGIPGGGSSTLGVGGAYYWQDTREMFDGYVMVRADIPLGDPLEEALLHELAHMVGLGHVEDYSQIMYPTTHQPPFTAYQNGDREGLWWVGSAQGCVASARFTSSGTVPNSPGGERPVGVVRVVD
ncbi:MAG: matrixin family metalloprotease [Ilumatobacteraceae bacterium]